MVEERPATPLQVDEDSGIISSTEAASVGSNDGNVSSKQPGSTINSSYKYQFQGGRRFHDLDYQVYMLPNDETEYDRLNIQHTIFRLSTQGPLQLAPVPEDAKNVLDIGTGSGIWAIEYAKEHPKSKVLGVDLSPVDAADVPENCSFKVMNVESEWDPAERYDFIHSRALVIGMKNWPQFIKTCFEHLKPGGYLELQETNFPPGCLDPSSAATSKTVEYSNMMIQALKRAGSDLQAPLKFKEQFIAAGFVDIHIKWYHWPIGPWAKGDRLKAMGTLMRKNLKNATGPVMMMISKSLGKDLEEVKAIAAASKEEIGEQKTHLYVPICFIWARKPE